MIARIKKQFYDNGAWFEYILFDEQTGEELGYSGYKPFLIEQLAPELGYEIHPDDNFYEQI
jgi:hypothetical protein